LYLPALAQDLLLALFICVMQVQGTVARTHGDPATVLRPLTDLGNLGYLLLIVGGAVTAPSESSTTSPLPRPRP
jgi:hypothetical protein